MSFFVRRPKPTYNTQFNHHYDPEIAISYDEEGNCIAYTIKDVSAGSPLRISYGFDTNPSALFGECLITLCRVYETKTYVVLRVIIIKILRRC